MPSDNITRANTNTVTFNENGVDKNVNKIVLVKNGVTKTVWQKKQSALFRVTLKSSTGFSGGLRYWHLYGGDNNQNITIQRAGIGFSVGEPFEAIHPSSVYITGLGGDTDLHKIYGNYRLQQSWRTNTFTLTNGQRSGSPTIRGTVRSVNASGGITSVNLINNYQGTNQGSRAASYEFGNQNSSNSAYFATVTGQTLIPNVNWSVSLPGEGPTNNNAPSGRSIPNDGQESSGFSGQQSGWGGYSWSAR